MAKILKRQEMDGILQECRANGHLSEYSAGSEYFLRRPAILGQGWERTIDLRPGLRLYGASIVNHQIHVNKIRCHSPSMPLVLRYYLAGSSRMDNDGFSGELEEVEGKSYLYRLPKTGEFETYPAKKHLCCFHIQVAPELMCGFSDRMDELPTPLRSTLEDPANAIFYHSSSITSPERQVLQQILEWPYYGTARHLYLEGKVLELIALHLNQTILGAPQRTNPTSRGEIDRIYAARDILIQNFVSPPSLGQLARQVELTEVKLTRGFRQVFNTSVFNYLHDYRMEKACQLLQTGSHNIQEVARRVGYTSSSSFAKAFRKKFKVPPSVYLQKTG